MRFRLLLPVAVVACLVFFGVHLLAFIHLFYKHAGVAITQIEVLDASVKGKKVEGVKSREQSIPKIIHQVFHNWADPGNDTLPADWQVVSETCKTNNEGWEYILWTERISRDFIADKYPWFLSTYDGYRFPVQRVDTVKYFLMLHFGGIYLDLDNGCLQSLEPLLYYSLWTTDGGRGALSNNILGSKPNQPYYKLLTDSLISFDYNHIFPYVTISYASGQWFETAIWEKYHVFLGQNEVGYRVMMDDRPGTKPWVFFTTGRGGSWVNWDNSFWLWVGEHLIVLGLAGTMVFVVAVWTLVRWTTGGKRRKGCRKASKEEDAVNSMNREYEV